MSIRIGTGPNAWGVRRDPNQPDRVPWRRFLDEVVEAGYDWIEVGHYGYLPTDARTLRAELDSRGLNAIAATAMAGHLDHPSDWPRIETTVTRIGEVAASAGAKYLVLIDDSYTAPGSRVSAPETDDDGWKCLVEAIHRAADMVRERFALEMTFHPHADTHVETEEQTELPCWSSRTRAECRSASIRATRPTPAASRSRSCASTTSGFATCTSRT